MENNLIEALLRHTQYSFESIEILFSTFTEHEFSDSVGGFPIWQQFYHLINSIDRIYTDPKEYSFPAFHREGMHMLENAAEECVSKHTLLEYYQRVKSQVLSYLETADSRELFEKSNHKEISMGRIDHILAQLRHMGWHIGYLHCCAKLLHGRTPEHILVKNVPDYQRM